MNKWSIFKRESCHNKSKKEINNKKTIKTTFISLFLLITLFIVTNEVYGAASFQKPSIGQANIIYNDGSDYTPNSEDFPLNKNTTSAIGYDFLYGTSKSLVSYLGEVPFANKDDDFAEEYRYYPGDKIGKKNRVWSTVQLTADDISPDNEDELHIHAMTKSHGLFNFFSLVLTFVGFINYILSWAIGLMINIKSLNLASLIDIIDKDGMFQKQLASIFMINSDTGALSPLLVLSLVAFIISCVSLAFAVLKGDTSIRKLRDEVICLLIAAFIIGGMITPTNSQTLAETGINFINALTNNFIAGVAPSTKVFTYNTDNPNEDTASTQKGLIAKEYMDQMIYAQFGVTVDKLYITKPNGNDGYFGTKEQVKQALQEVFGSNATENSLSVVTDTSGENVINNLGYYFWAADSGTRINCGVGNSKEAFYSSGNSTIVRTGSTDRLLYTIDFLNADRKIQKDAGNDSIVTRIDTIMNHLEHPSYATACTGVLLICIQKVFLIISLVIVTLFSFIGQLIVIFGSYCLVIMPALIIFKQTRKTAKQMGYTYLLGFIRYVLGNVFFNSIIVIAVLFAEQGFLGIITSAAICFLIGKFAPNLLIAINQSLSDFGRGKELRFMSRAYNGMDKGIRYFDRGNKRNRYNAANIINRDGSITTAAKGIDKDNKGINPFSKKRDQFKEDLYNSQADNEKLSAEDKDQNLFVIKGDDNPEFDNQNASTNIETSKEDSKQEQITQNGGIDSKDERSLLGQEQESSKSTKGLSGVVLEDDKDGQSSKEINSLEAIEQSQNGENFNENGGKVPGRNLQNSFEKPTDITEDEVDNTGFIEITNKAAENDGINTSSQEAQDLEPNTRSRNTGSNVTSINEIPIDNIPNDGSEFHQQQQVFDETTVTLSQQEPKEQEVQIENINFVNGNINPNNSIDEYSNPKNKNVFNARDDINIINQANVDKNGKSKSLYQQQVDENYHEYKKEERKLKLINAGLKASAQINAKIPFSGGKTINQIASEKISKNITQNNKNKEEIKQNIVNLMSGTDSNMSFNEASQIVKNQMLNQTAESSKDDRSKSIDKALDSFTKGDLKDLQNRIKNSKR